MSVGKVTASTSKTIAQAPDRVLAALADYETVRPRILPEQYRDYAVVEGGQGSGTVVQWILQATSKRSRNMKMSVTVEGMQIVERDANSSLVTTWTVAPSGSGSEVTVLTEWDGAGGIGGFFEKIFAPRGLNAIQAQTLTNLQKHVH